MTNFNQERCANCKFYVRHEKFIDQGFCHRYPPKPAVKTKMYGLEFFEYLPEVIESFWCGEYKNEENYAINNRPH